MEPDAVLDAWRRGKVGYLFLRGQRRKALLLQSPEKFPTLAATSPPPACSNPPPSSKICQHRDMAPKKKLSTSKAAAAKRERKKQDAELCKQEAFFPPKYTDAASLRRLRVLVGGGKPRPGLATLSPAMEPRGKNLIPPSCASWRQDWSRRTLIS